MAVLLPPLVVLGFVGAGYLLAVADCVPDRSPGIHLSGAATALIIGMAVALSWRERRRAGRSARGDEADATGQRRFWSTVALALAGLALLVLAGGWLAVGFFPPCR